jgi:hypothetical protein
VAVAVETQRCRAGWKKGKHKGAELAGKRGNIKEQSWLEKGET